MYTLDEILSGGASPPSPAVVEALRRHVDGAGRYHVGGSLGPGHSWRDDWYMRVCVGDRPDVEHARRGSRRCSCGCWGLDPCASEQLGTLLERALQELGYWTGIARSCGIRKVARCLRRSHRAAARNRIRVELEWFPTGASARFYVDPNADHPNGARYGEPEKAARYLDRKLLELTRRRLTRLLVENGFPDRSDPRLADPIDQVAYDQRRSWHWRPGVGLRPTAGGDRNRDGDPIVEGGQVLIFGAQGEGGAPYLGRAFSALNHMWWVVHPGGLCVVDSRQIFTPRSPLPRRFHTADRRRVVLTRLEEKYVKARNYERAIGVRDALNALRAGGL